MIKHLFKLAWNRKRKNFLMVAEILFSFLILFAVSSILLNYAFRYMKPIGFDYQSVWIMRFNETGGMPHEEGQARLEQLIRQMNEVSQVESVALGSANSPYTGWMSSTTLNEISANVMDVHNNEYLEVMGLLVVEGRWFQEEDRVRATHDKLIPIVLTKDIRDALFGEKQALNKTLNEDQYKVIGVVEAFRPGGEFSDDEGSFFVKQELADTTYGLPNVLYLRIEPGTPAAFEETIMQEASSILGPGYTLSLMQLDELRDSYFVDNLVPIGMFVLVGLFLVLNVALGIFGVLWYNINKRYSEIGLRRALGATANSIYKQFLGEVLVLATLSLAIGCFFAIQFLMLNILDLQAEVYYTALASSILLIYILVICCALYPSRQAAAIHPATALHEE